RPHLRDALGRVECVCVEEVPPQRLGQAGAHRGLSRARHAAEDHDHEERVGTPKRRTPALLVEVPASARCAESAYGKVMTTRPWPSRTPCSCTTLVAVGST